MPPPPIFDAFYMAMALPFAPFAPFAHAHRPPNRIPLGLLVRLPSCHFLGVLLTWHCRSRFAAFAAFVAFAAFAAFVVFAAFAAFTAFAPFAPFAPFASFAAFAPFVQAEQAQTHAR